MAPGGHVSTQDQTSQIYLCTCLPCFVHVSTTNNILNVPIKHTQTHQPPKTSWRIVWTEPGPPCDYTWQWWPTWQIQMPLGAVEEANPGPKLGNIYYKVGSDHQFGSMEWHWAPKKKGRVSYFTSLSHVFSAMHMGYNSVYNDRRGPSCILKRSWVNMVLVMHKKNPSTNTTSTKVIFRRDGTFFRHNLLGRVLFEQSALWSEKTYPWRAGVKIA